MSEDLMKPRYKVVADYPQSNYKVGTIIEFQDEKQSWFTGTLDWVSKPYSNGGYTAIVCIKQFEPYPHIFKPLEWWEERSESEVPLFVKNVGNGRVAKVRFDLQETSSWFMYLDGEVHPYAPGGSALVDTHWLPATEEEYKQYKLSHP